MNPLIQTHGRKPLTYRLLWPYNARYHHVSTHCINPVASPAFRALMDRPIIGAEVTSLSVIGHCVVTSGDNPLAASSNKAQPMTAAEQFAENTAAYIRRRLASERDEFDIIRSVLAYLNWRVESVRVRGLSWRNQPAELGCYVHAINLINQAQSRTGINPADERSDRNPECERNPVATPRAQSIAPVELVVIPPKKQPASIVIPKSRKAHA